MASPTVETIWQHTTTFGSATVTYPEPDDTNIASGDLLLGFCAHKCTSTASYSGPSGYTQVAEDQYSTATSSQVIWKESSGTESGGPTSTDNGGGTSVAFIIHFKGNADPDTSPPTASSTTGDSTTQNPPNHTYTSGDYQIVAVAATEAAGTAQSVSTWSLANNQTENHIGVYAASLACSTLGVTSSSSYDPGAYTLADTEQFVAWTIAVPGVAAGGAANPHNPFGHPILGAFGGPV